ncbi:MAG: hypothetical protein QOD74_2187 [Variibacter sp.]|jgi:hypothetical protein|nr:hypothetical protein [Variibacter sp.]
MPSTLKHPADLDVIRSFTRTVPVNIEAAIRGLGIALRKDAADLEEKISGQIRRLPDGGYEIATNGREHYFRQRFTMAHELGHYVLHRDLIGDGVNDDTMYRSTALGNFYNTRIGLTQEAQANSFAANLLMPAEAMATMVAGQSQVDPRPLATKFQVSPSAMRWRLRSLDITLAPT